MCRREGEGRIEAKKGCEGGISKRTDGCSKKNSKEEKEEITIQREIKSDAVKETGVAGSVKE